jgi:DNA-binding response OmpR family regulator
MKTILVIEDEEEILFTIRDFLISEGYNVLTAINGFLAMEILQTSVVPDLILLDMKMPVMNGWEFSSAFIEKYDHMSPILVMTAASDAGQRAKDIQAIGWIEKPFALDAFLEKVKMYERK